MKRTTDYFNLTVSELQEMSGRNGSTREECQILDTGIFVSFFKTICEYEKEKASCVEWFRKNMGFELKTVLLTTDERVAMIFI